MLHHINSEAANETGLNLLTQYDCGCPKQNVSYECSVVGGLITVWSGSAFMCGARKISLRHNDFQAAMGICNEGAIVAYSVENVDNCYTSRLDVTLSDELQGQSISCSRDDGSTPTTLGLSTLNISTQSGI